MLLIQIYAIARKTLSISYSRLCTDSRKSDSTSTESEKKNPQPKYVTGIFQSQKPLENRCVTN